MRQTFSMLQMLLCLSLTQAQTAHLLPFASQNNAVELAIANTAAVPVQGVQVRVLEAPVWVRLDSRSQTVEYLDPGANQTVRFAFSVATMAPVGKEEAMSFLVELATGQQYRRDFRIAVTPPEEYEIFQNYPNPFNPATTIAYQLPALSEVRLTVYNMLGQEVGKLFEGMEPPGYHEHVWDATGVASGTYFYRLTVRETPSMVRTSTRIMQVVK